MSTGRRGKVPKRQQRKRSAWATTQQARLDAEADRQAGDWLAGRAARRRVEWVEVLELEQAFEARKRARAEVKVQGQGGAERRH